ILISSLLLTCSCLVFFKSPGTHRDLHSFPTRRSSDLAPHRAHWRACPSRSPTRCPRPPRRDDAQPAPSSPAAAFRPRSPGCNRRSEEHTSELQSRENLVCRLLLEKKKKTNQHSTTQRT